MSKTYTIPVVWESWGTMVVEADSIEDAKRLVLEELPLPEANYVDDSIQIDDTSLDKNQ